MYTMATTATSEIVRLGRPEVQVSRDVVVAAILPIGKLMRQKLIALRIGQE
jgi:hypothetical protein